MTTKEIELLSSLKEKINGALSCDVTCEVCNTQLTDSLDIIDQLQKGLPTPAMTWEEAMIASFGDVGGDLDLYKPAAEIYMTTNRDAAVADALLKNK